MRTRWIFLTAFVPLVLGCSSGGGEDLSAATVTNLPDGTGTGTAASGVYTVQLDVTACSGSCGTVVAGFSVSVCTVGPAGSAAMTVVQSGGHLTVLDGSSNVVVHSLSGGIDANGDFDVGGLATQVLGQDLTVTTRATGSLNGNAVTGVAESLGTGTVNGASINCVQTLDISGSR